MNSSDSDAQLDGALRRRSSRPVHGALLIARGSLSPSKAPLAVATLLSCSVELRV